MRAWAVTYHGTIAGLYSSAVDAEVVLKALVARGCHGGLITELRMNCETDTGAQLLCQPG
eukprot:COSAG03_NODE_1358_length_4263_cov_241.470221_5_plen_60_part_00